MPERSQIRKIFDDKWEVDIQDERGSWEDYGSTSSYLSALERVVKLREWLDD